jgi:uncharacterized protein (TIGR02147 family)
MKRTKLRVQNFTDFHGFLNAHILEMKKLNPRWSLGSWTMKMGFGSRTTLVKILNGQRKPGPKMVQAFLEYFEFEGAEANHFCGLVQLKKSASDSDLQEAILNRLQKSPRDIPVEDIEQSTQSIFNHWYCLPILAMIHSKRFSQEPEKIAERLYFPIGAQEVTRTLEDLTRGGLLTRNKKGRLEIVKDWQMLKPVHVRPQNPDVEKAAKAFFAELLKNTVSQIPQLPSGSANMQALCVSIQHSKLKQAVELIKEFSEKFSEMVNDDSGEEIYQLQIQFLPVTKAH